MLNQNLFVNNWMKKNKFRLSAKKRMADHRENVDDAEKVEIRDKDKKRKTERDCT